MALPNKRKPLADKARIEKALEAAGVESEPHKEAEKPQTIRKKSVEEAEKNESLTKPKRRNRLGRPPLADDRSARMSFYLSPETSDRFELAFMQEQYKQAKNRNKIDKSLLLETIMIEWLTKNKY